MKKHYSKSEAMRTPKMRAPAKFHSTSPGSFGRHPMPSMGRASKYDPGSAANATNVTGHKNR